LIKVQCKEYNREKKEYQFFEGEFLQWGIDYEEFDLGPGCHTVAIVKREDGQVDMVYAAFVKFLNPPKSEQGDSKNSTPSAKQQTHDVILAAAYNWANGNPNAFGINGFQAGVEWAQKQQHAS
jgi:hypothetical protein